MSTLDLIMLIFLAIVLIGGMVSLFVYMKDD
jgi:cbb3-type cytochrome oxidase subunit 3